MKSRKEQEHEFIYSIDEAMKIVWANISIELRSKFSFEEIKIVLEIQEEVLEEMDVIQNENEKMSISDFPIEIDSDELNYKIINYAAKRNIYLSFDELNEILDGETLYLDINGQIEDMESYLN
jgi:hypothetical protein